MVCPTCNGRTVVPGNGTWENCPTCGCKGRVPDDLGVTLADLPEAAIQEECCKFLQEDNWRILVTSPVSNRSRGIGFGELGMGDVLALRPLKITSSLRRADLYACEVLWLEFKAGREQAKSHQVKWHRDERARGFMTWIANADFPATVEGFKAHYDKSGLRRRPL